MAITIKDVANMAGVSVATVSRAMNNSAKVSSAKKKRIDNAIKELDYMPNILAQNMISKRLNNIGVVLSHSPDRILQTPYVSRMMIGFANGFMNTNSETILVLANTAKEETEKCIKLYNYGAANGFILMGARCNDQTCVELYKRNIPFVILGHPDPDAKSGVNSSMINSVDTDSISDTKEITRLLISKGHRRIALIHSSLDYMVNRERLSGYRLALAESNINYSPELVFEIGYTIEDALESAHSILNLKQLPDAVVTSDDMKAVTFIKCATEKNIRVPEDISVVGHNNYSESMICTPSLTTVNVPIEELGLVCANLLTQIIKEPNQSPQRIILPTYTVMRDSVADIKL